MTDKVEGITQLTYQLNDYPGFGKSLLYGIQHVLVMFTAMVGMPIIVANALNLSPELRTVIINATMIGCGIGTIVQALGVGFIGARLPIVMGVFYIFIGPILAITSQFSLAAAMTALFIGGLIEFAFSPLIGKSIKLFPPLVTGTVITIIGICLLPIAINSSTGLYTPLFGKPLTLILAALIVVLIIVINMLTKGFLKTISLFAALVIGYILAAIFGLIDFKPVAEAHWFMVPKLFPYGPWQWPGLGGLIAIIICYFVSSIETVGDTLAVSKAVNVEATHKRVRGAIAVDGLCSSISSLFGGTALTSYSQNIGVITLTGVGSRFIVAVGGAFLIIMALFSKVGAVISVMPAPVLGGTLIVMFGMVASIGIDIISKNMKTRRDALLVATSLGVAVGITVAPAGAFEVIPASVRIVVGDGIVMGAILAIVLNKILPQQKD